MPIIKDNWKFLKESYDKCLFILQEQSAKLKEMYPDQEALHKDIDAMKTLQSEIKDAKKGLATESIALQSKMEN